MNTATTEAKEPKVKKAKKLTIKDQVAAATDVLKAMATHTELRAWAISNGMDNRAAFPKFKEGLLAIGIDYEQIKTGVQTVKADELEKSITHELTLYVDAKASAGRYGICDRDGNVLWHGRFFENDDAGEQSRAELCAAEKAVWLASKVKEALGLQSLALNLWVDAQWLTYQDHGGQKGYKLTQAARKWNLKLNVQWIPGKKNPADEWTVAPGFKKWSDNDLTALCEPYTPEAEQE